MRISKVLALSWFGGLLVGALCARTGLQQWQLALPGYRFQFPRDHFDHPDYATEWWYYTGNLRAPDGHAFGYELTFFRRGTKNGGTALQSPAWRVDDLYLAHLALTDVDGQHFYHESRLNRAGPGLAGISAEPGRYWNGNWQVRWVPTTSGEQQLEAGCAQFRLELLLKPAKPPVIHGQNGVSIKGPGLGEASHYVSFTRLATTGSIHVAGRQQAVSGLSWMDHEFFSSELNEHLAGWDWMCMQMDNQEEVMIYRLRRKDGRVDAASSGTWIDAKGGAHYIEGAAITLMPGSAWSSLRTHARYPLQWQIAIPRLGLSVAAQTPVPDQELAARSSLEPSYWEGVVRYRGAMHGAAVSGVGYLEMTGYDRRLELDLPRAATR